MPSFTLLVEEALARSKTAALTTTTKTTKLDE